VIERPASVIKELIENAIDAGSTRIDVVTAAGGKTLIRVSDNGHGMTAENLSMAVERHCTSKLTDDLMESDLFYATPARLKFLKSDRAETNAITDVFKRVALAFPHIRFSISGDDRSTLDYPATTQFDRLTQVLGKDFTENSMKIDAGREGVLLQGFASVPTYHRGNALAQYFFVNGPCWHFS